MSFRWSLGISTGLFGIGIVLGLAAPAGLAELMSRDLAALEELGSMLPPFQVSTALFILAKNVSALLVSFIFSPLLCLFPVMALLLNGWLLSLVGAAVVQQKSLSFLLAGLLPHGILELPALFIGEAAALSSGVLVMAALLSPERRSQLLPGLKRNLRYLAIALILMVPAAILETFITPLLIS